MKITCAIRETSDLVAGGSGFYLDNPQTLEVILMKIVLAAIVAVLMASQIQSSDAQSRESRPDGPPVLSNVMANPSWTIYHWMSVDKKGPDCIAADKQFMDRNRTSRTVVKRRSSRTYYLADYIRSCRNRIQRMLNVVEPQAKQWCAYRHTSPRLETICHEWEANKDNYIAQIKRLDGPTFERYARFTSGVR